MKILMVASEAEPFAKTGGLADVLGSLPAALNEEGADVRVIMPKYGTIKKELKETIKHKCSIFVDVGWRHQYCGIEEAHIKGVTYYFIDNEYYFNREYLYGYGDDGERFAFFNNAVLEALPYLEFIPDVIHCHDWQAGMVPVILKAQYQNLDIYNDIKTFFTIHNLRYQGICGIDQMKDWFSLSDFYFTSDKLEIHKNSSFMKGGLTYSNLISTVSDTYSKEIKEPFYGENMEGLLNARENDLVGILNGIDYDEYDPSTDKLIFTNFSKNSMTGKAVNKVSLQEELGLEIDENKIMIGLISRLVDQKGLDLITYVFEEIMLEKIQFVILGTGEYYYEQFFREAMLRYPGRVSANIKFDNILAHKIYASSDIFLMPSLFEPCGLGQIISLRYGTLPVVRETGGLKDTVIPYNYVTGEGNGFSFANYNAYEMLDAILLAVDTCEKKLIRNKLRKSAMQCDFSWHASAKEYIKMYSII